MMQVDYDRRFDRCHPKAGRIFLAELCDSVMANGRVIYPGAFPDVLIASSPHIEAGTMITPYDKRNYLSVGEGSEAKGFRENVTTCHPAIVDMFGFSFVEGDKDCLADPEKAIIPESMARRMFGGEPAVGRQLHFKESVWTKVGRDLTVGASTAIFRRIHSWAIRSTPQSMPLTADLPSGVGRTGSATCSSIVLNLPRLWRTISIGRSISHKSGDANICTSGCCRLKIFII